MFDLSMFRENEWVCVANNAKTGVSTWAMRDGEDVIFQTRQDASVLLDENQAIRNVTSSSWKGESLHSVARLPTEMMYSGSFHEAAKVGDDKWIKKFLNDSDHSKFRTKEGTL